MKTATIKRAIEAIGCSTMDTISRMKEHIAFHVIWRNEQYCISYALGGWCVSGDYKNGYNDVQKLKYTLQDKMREFGEPIGCEYRYW